jgi:hypothetical protein
MSTKPQQTQTTQAKQPQAKQPQQTQTTQAKQPQAKPSIPSNIASGITTGLGMGLGMEAARAASDSIFTKNETEVVPSTPQIVNAYKCEDLLKELNICLNKNNYLGNCEGILDRYKRCLKNEY